MYSSGCNRFSLSPYFPRRKELSKRRAAVGPGFGHQQQLPSWVQCISEDLEPLSPIAYQEPCHYFQRHDGRSQFGRRFKNYGEELGSDGQIQRPGGHGHRVGYQKNIPQNAASRPRPLSSLSVIVACAISLLGTTWQLYTLVSEFVSYEMVSDVFITKDDFVKPPAMSICFPYTEVIDLSATPEKGRDKSHPEFTRYVQETYTVAWILNRTFSVEKLLNESWIRKENSYGFVDTTDPNIYEKLAPQITVTKYLKDFYVCYRFMNRFGRFVTFVVFIKFDDFPFEKQENSYGYVDTRDPNIYDKLAPQITVTKYLKDFYVCYRFMNKRAEEDDFYFRSHHISFGQLPGKVMGLYFSKPAFKPITRAMVYLHDPSIYPRGDRDYPLILMANIRDVFDDESTYWGISYTKTTLHLLT